MADPQNLPEIVGLQQFNINGYLHLPEADLQEQNTKNAHANGFDNVGPNLFEPLDANNAHHTAHLLSPADGNSVQVAVGTLDIHDPHQLALQNLQNAANPLQVAVGALGIQDPHLALQHLQNTGNT